MVKKHGFISTEEKREKRKKALMSLILAGLMFFSVFAMGISYLQTEKIKFNEHTFKISNDEKYGNTQVLTTKFNDKEIFFYTYPEQAMSIPVEGNLTNILKNSNEIVFTYDPTSNISSIVDSIRYEFSTLSDKQFYASVNDIYENYESFPVITCANSSINLPVIYFMETTNTTNIFVNESCVIVNLKLNEAVYLRDRLLLSITGISSNWKVITWLKHTKI